MLRVLFFTLVEATSLVLVLAPPIRSEEVKDVWLVRLLLNLLAYATLVVPAAFLIRYLKRINYKEKGSGICFPVVNACVFGEDLSESKAAEHQGPITSLTREQSMSTYVTGIKLAVCTAGLQVAYLTWGVIQERIMTIEYGKTDDTPGEKFKNSQFLVFVNRLLAFIVSALYITLTRQPRHSCPLHKFSYSSISNIMSSWFQYEALKFVSFPTQVLGKACKVIPVMLMGKVVSGNTYEFYEWATAGMLSVGISLFLLAQGQTKEAITMDTTSGMTMFAMSSGVILMMGYMAFDSFTSNWQGQLFKTHKMSSFQMMFGVNLFSCLFTSVALLEQGGFFEAFAFMATHWDFALHAVVLSICSALGQLFIFYTISEFGAVIFTIIMTTRQALAILLSCLIYGHPVSAIGFLGISVVFIALFLRIYARTRKSALTKQQKPSLPSGKK